MNSILHFAKTFAFRGSLAIVVSAITIGFTGSAKAQAVIYSDSLISNDYSAINGSTPDTTDTGGATWNADTAWERTPVGTGFYGGANPQTGSAAYLPFTPTAGNSYLLQATFLPNQQSDAACGAEFGFTSSADFGLNWQGFATNRVDTVTFGDQWQAPDNVYFNQGGWNTASFGPLGGTDTLTVSIYLTASGDSWTSYITGFDNGTQTTVFDSGTPAEIDGSSIADIGFLTTNGATLLSNVTLVQQGAVPEPGTYASLAAGMGMLLAFRNIRRRSR